MYRLKAMVAIGCLGALLGGAYSFGAEKWGQPIFAGGICLIAVGLAGLAVLDELRRRPP